MRKDLWITIKNGGVLEKIRDTMLYTPQMTQSRNVTPTHDLSERKAYTCQPACIFRILFFLLNLKPNPENIMSPIARDNFKFSNFSRR